MRAQLLDAPRPTDLLEVVQRLTLLQIDPTAAIAPTADLVLWSRLGSAYRPEQLRRALEEERTLFELDAMVRPMSDLGLYLADVADWPHYERHRDWLRDNDRFRRDLLDLLRSSGPLSSRDIPDTCVVPWASTGWTNNRNVTQMLELLIMGGEVAIAGRVGRERLWDLAERVYPAGIESPARRRRAPRNERRLASLGIARQKARRCRWSRPRRRRRRACRGRGRQGRVARRSGRARRALQRKDGAALAVRPADPRPRPHRGVFDFEYSLEMYKPAEQRRWGYYALPILHGDQLVGKLDAAADRRASVLRVNAIHEDVKFTPAITKAVRAEIADLAAWLGLEVAA